jgi:hypothetical protein
MKKQIFLVSFISGILSIASAISAVSRPGRNRAATETLQPEKTLTSRDWPPYLTFDIIPPLEGSFVCGRTTGRGIWLTVRLLDSSKTSDKCNQIDAYISEGIKKGQTPYKFMDIIWVCPDEVHLTVPTPVIQNPAGGKFIFVGDADFPSGHERTMAMLNVTDADHDPPVDITSVQVMVGYDFSDEGKPAINYLYCM